MDWAPDEDFEDFNESILGDVKEGNSQQEYTDEEREDVRYRVAANFTGLAVQIFEGMQSSTTKNQALGIMIEALSETLGNFVSLVKESEQEDVILSAMQVVETSTSLQQESIAHMIYGQVGHS